MYVVYALNAEGEPVGSALWRGESLAEAHAEAAGCGRPCGAGILDLASGRWDLGLGAGVALPDADREALEDDLRADAARGLADEALV